MTLIALTNVGGCNLYSEIAIKNSDAVISIDIQKLVDASLWYDAIQKWQTLSVAGQATRTNIVLLASAYAGRGGLSMLSLAQNLQNLGSSSSSLFSQLLTAFRGSTAANYSDEVTAQNLILSIGASASLRTVDENTFMLFVEIAKLGTMLASTADPLNTGSVTATFNNCTQLSSAQGAEVITAIGNIVDSVTAIGAGVVGQSLTALLAACTQIQVSAPGACSVTTTASVTPTMIRVARTLVGESNLNVGLAAPYNKPYCQITATPVAPAFCPGGTGLIIDVLCP